MAETQIYYIETNNFSYITGEGAKKEFTWNNPQAFHKYASPYPKSKKKVKYSATKKAKTGGMSSWKDGDGATHHGTVIPRTAQRTVEGVTETVPVKYRERGYTIYKRTSALKKQKKMLEYKYPVSTNPYQYQIMYKDKIVYYNDNVSELSDGTLKVFFADHYYDNAGESVDTVGHIPHPVEISMSYKDVRKTTDTSNANNQESRDNAGKYILKNVRANVRVMTCTWRGLSAEDGAQLLAVLNPDLEGSTNKPYINIQFLDYEKNEVMTSTFFAGDRTVKKYPNGYFEEISCTFEEV